MLSIGTKILFILAVFLLVVNVFAVVVFETTDSPVLFTTVLQRMEEAPNIDIGLDTSISYFQINDEWEILDGIRVFINYIGSILGFIVYLITVLINLILSIVWFLYLLGVTSFSSVAV